eukprot:CAMPEP_0194126960 /NCGR_PEP_ID=MMETSP0150-20130528/60266_1 /TAXON_ID=122233 /ORGANISM="Chaetoceros debilis, Strain MM31A-1" /LENGTH=284 /DNA_ID=CAMNT_0038820851 /DNA_START=490 /DNA_END=1343 /DNA_ORIENTATION=+
MRLNPDNDSLSSVGDDQGGEFNKYSGTVVGKDDCLYNIPSEATCIVKFDLNNPDTTSTVGEKGGREFEQCGNGVLSDDGYNYYMGAGQILQVDTASNDGRGFVQQVQMEDPKYISRGKSWRDNCKVARIKTQTEKIELTIDVSKGMRPGERITFEGVTWRDNCKARPNKKEKIELTIDVSKGMRPGERITFEGVTDEKPGFEAGDLHFVLGEIPQADYHRDGDHLYLSRDISLVDSLTGFTLGAYTHVDDHKFTVDVDGVTECDYGMSVPGKGMPRRSSGRGFG